MKKGEITVFVSLLLAVMLLFFQICLQSARIQLQRSRMEEALELCEYSVLSEFQPALLEHYDLFYLDLAYGRPEEKPDYLQQRILYFLNENLGESRTGRLETAGFSRATDEHGAAYYEQAVSAVKEKYGMDLLREFQDFEDMGREAARKEQEFQEQNEKKQEELEQLKKRREEEEEEGTADPVSGVNELRSGSLLHLLVRDTEQLSGRVISPQLLPSERTNIPGSGRRGIVESTWTNDQFFHAYLSEKFSNAAGILNGKQEAGGWLSYQLEYILIGKESDLKNLEAVALRLLAVREGLNYAYLLSDAEKSSECKALATAIVGFTLIPELVEAMYQVILLTWAFGESVLDVRGLLCGNKLDFWKTRESWKLPLSGLLSLQEHVDDYDSHSDPMGLDYEKYLCLLLNLMGREKKIMRSMDAIEGVLHKIPGSEYLYLDRCTDGFSVRITAADEMEFIAERQFSYEW